MRIVGKITKIYPQRSGVSKKTGKAYTVTELHFAWKEGTSIADARFAMVRCSTMQDLDMLRLRQAYTKQEDVSVALLFDVRESTKQPDTWYNEVKVFLPAEFLNKTLVGPASDSAQSNE